MRTHLARSDDGGATFSYVRAVNETEQISHPDTGVPGWTMHEVSTLAYAPSAWQLLWLTYFEPYGQPDSRSDVYYARSTASTPGALGDVSQPWVRGDGTSASFGAQYNLSDIPQLSDCVAFTEPALLVEGGVTYLATNCVVFVAGVRRPDMERLVLLREEADGYSYAGVLLTYADALDLGGTRVEQADLSVLAQRSRAPHRHADSGSAVGAPPRLCGPPRHGPGVGPGAARRRRPRRAAG